MDKGLFFNLLFGIGGFLIGYLICLAIAYSWFQVGKRVKLQQENNELLKKILEKTNPSGGVEPGCKA